MNISIPPELDVPDSDTFLKSNIKRARERANKMNLQKIIVEFLWPFFFLCLQYYRATQFEKYTTSALVANRRVKYTIWDTAGKSLIFLMARESQYY